MEFKKIIVEEKDSFLDNVADNSVLSPSKWMSMP